MKNFLASGRGRAIAVGSAILLALVAGVGGVYWYYTSHALPGSAVGSVSIAGMTRDQANAAVAEQVKSLTASVKTEAGDKSTALADAGITVDVNQSVQKAFSASFFPGIFGVSATAPVVTVNEERVSAFAQSLPLPEGSAAVEAAVSWDKNSQAFSVKEGKNGKKIDSAALRAGLVKRAESLKGGVVETSLVAVEPQVGTAQATEAAAKVNKWLTVPLSVTDSEGDALAADIPTRAKWVKFSAGPGKLTPVIDTKAISAWIADYASYTETKPVTGLRNVDSSGKTVATARPASEGWVVKNIDAIAKLMVGSLDSGKPVDAVFKYGETGKKWEDRPVAPGSENLVYRPAVGEKWIDLNLSNSTVTAYEGTKVVGGTFYMVPGAPETPTVTGEFNINQKYELQDMRGLNADGTKYLTEDVPWISYFYNGYGFHGAPWRSSFGWSGAGGSHGCVNMPVADAKFIFEWSEIGTKVVSHY